MHKEISVSLHSKWKRKCAQNFRLVSKKKRLKSASNRDEAQHDKAKRVEWNEQERETRSTGLPTQRHPHKLSETSGWVGECETRELVSLDQRLISASSARLGFNDNALYALRWAPHWAVLAVAVGLAVYWSANRPTNRSPDQPNDRLEPRICKIQATSVKCCFLMPHFIHWSFQ